MSITYLKEEARSWAIREAGRLETQAIAMAGQADHRANETAAIVARIAALTDEVEKVRDVALEAVAAARAAATELSAEVEKLATIRRQLEADKADGKPFMVEITIP